MELWIYEADSLSVPERIPDTRVIYESSRQDSDLLLRDSCSCPWNPETADNYSG